jgi:protein-disulfide isomerase
MSQMIKPLIFVVVLITLLSIPSISADDTSGQILGGSPSAPVRIEVYSDFQCPHCREFYLNTIKPVMQDYAGKDKVCVIYHEFPLAMHPLSKEAARYTEAAAQLGQQKLVLLYDSIFTNQAQWSQDGKLEAMVAKALSQDDFLKVKGAMNEPAINAAIEKEIALGVKNEVNSTPTMIIYYIGKQQKVEGLVTYPVLKQFIDTVVK